MKRTMVFLAWASLLAMLSIGFSRYLDQQAYPNKDLSMGLVGQEAVVTLRQNRQGHYIAPGKINGYPVTFILDTGATSISIPARLAANIGLAEGSPVRTRTANGDITVYRLTLQSVQVGSIVMKGVLAHLNPHMQGKDVLLGMSFLKHLEMIQKGREITLSLPRKI